jgi:hypothetical protein
VTTADAEQRSGFLGLQGAAPPPLGVQGDGLGPLSTQPPPRSCCQESVDKANE